jgi:hypothetical protein
MFIRVINAQHTVLPGFGAKYLTIAQAFAHQNTNVAVTLSV